MSSLAEFFAVQHGDVEVLVAEATPGRRLFGGRRDDFEATFAALADPAGDFDWSGHWFGVLLPYLEEHGVPDLEGELGADAAALSAARGTTFLLFGADAKRHLAALDPARHDERQLRTYANAFLEDDDPDAGRALAAALAALRDRLAALPEGSVLVLRVG